MCLFTEKLKEQLIELRKLKVDLPHGGRGMGDGETGDGGTGDGGIGKNE